MGRGVLTRSSGKRNANKFKRQTFSYDPFNNLTKSGSSAFLPPAFLAEFHHSAARVAREHPRLHTKCLLFNYGGAFWCVSSLFPHWFDGIGDRALQNRPS